MASSLLYPGERIFDDSTPEHHYATPEGFSTGLDLSLRTAEGYGAAAEPFPESLLIPRSEWQARIEEMEQQKSRLSDLIIAAKLPPKDQNGTNYCWINSPTHALEVVRLVQNEPMVILSPASAGAQIKGFRNVGGWGREALEWIAEHGLVPVDKWPPNAIDRRYATEENKQLALKYRAQRWWVLDNSLDQHISCLLHRIPVCVGLAYWSHEVLDCDPVWVNGAIGVRFRNSWTADWPTPGAGGWSIRQGRKITPDDSVAPVVALAS